MDAPSGIRVYAAAFLFTVSYMLLPFGLMLPLFKMDITFMFMKIMDEELSTVGSIRKLWNTGHAVPAFLILFFSILVPLAKLSMLITCLLTKKAGSSALGGSLMRAIRSTARWAMVDALSAVLFLAGFVANPIINVSLCSGFYCFVAYCLLAIAAAQVLPVEALGAAEEGPKTVVGRITFLMIAAGAIITLLLGIGMPCIRLDVAMIGMHQEVDPIHQVQQATKRGYFNGVVGPIALAIFLAAVVPGSEVVARVFQQAHIAEALGHWSMSDVYAVAVVVSYLVMNTTPKTSANFVQPATACLALHAVLLNTLRTMTTSSVPSSNSRVPLSKEV